jgi:4-amino-4-deoxy-L-arabinose transferase-like glycosyltransferase
MSSKVQDVTSDVDVQVLAGFNSSKQGFETRFWGAGGRRAAFWTIVVVFGFLQAWSHRLLVDHDGVAYLDIAENYARGAWSSAINAYYSPLYSWLMAVVMLLKLPRSWESTLLHMVNLAGYLGAYASFEFFLRQLIRTEQGNPHSQHDQAGLTENAWQTLGLGLFLYSTLFMANLSGHSGQGDPGSTPDIFVMLFIFLAMGLLVRIQSGQARAGSYSMLGALLGLGYLAKTVMFPLAFVFMAVAGLVSLRRSTKITTFLLVPVCFALVAGPWIAVLSHAERRYTFGDAGMLTYRWEAGPQANPSEWGGQTQEQERESLVHPPRRLFLDPPVYEFATPVAGTFPLWYGNSYWLRGLKFHFSRVGQLRIIHEGYNNYRSILDSQKEYLTLFLLLILLQGAALQYFKVFLRGWVLWFPALAACGLYLLVRVEPRYVAPFIVILWLAGFAAVKLPRNQIVRRVAMWAVVAAVLATGIDILHEGLADFHVVARNASSQQAEVARGLRTLGIQEGQTLATIGIPLDSFYWARLAGVRVISEIPTPSVNQYWFASSDTQEKVRTLFAQAGAVAIVTDAMPAAVHFPEYNIPISVPGWERIGSTSYFFFPLRTEAPVQRAAVESKVLRDR